MVILCPTHILTSHTYFRQGVCLFAAAGVLRYVEDVKSGRDNAVIAEKTSKKFDKYKICAIIYIGKTKGGVP